VESTSDQDRQRKRRKKGVIAVGIAAGAAALVAIGAGTYAAFTDVENTQAGTIEAGTLDLTVGGSGSGVLLAAENIKPGDTGNNSLTFHNGGTVPGTLAITYQAVGDENGCNEPETAANGCHEPNGDLLNTLNVTVTSSNGGSETGTLGEFAAAPGELADLGTVQGGGDVTVTVAYEVPDTAGNEIQSDGITLSASATLTQA
jgi:predicted ribosomally synthesized peptide with SipW-like signal peptide